jgi:hypothetical protein
MSATSMSSNTYATYEPLEVITENNKIENFILRCPYSKCNARIIKPSEKCDIIEDNIEIEFIRPSSATDESETSVVEDDHKFLRIDDVWDFDNIGVSKNFDNKHDIERLIICSDCDRGPLGFAKFDLGNEDKNVKDLRYYLSLGSCVYQKS